MSSTHTVRAGKTGTTFTVVNPHGYALKRFSGTDAEARANVYRADAEAQWERLEAIQAEREAMVRAGTAIIIDTDD